MMLACIVNCLAILTRWLTSGSVCSCWDGNYYSTFTEMSVKGQSSLPFSFRDAMGNKG